MDFNPESSTKSTFIDENKDYHESNCDPTRSTFGKSSTIILQNQYPDSSPINQDLLCDPEKKSFENNSFTISQEESSPTLKKIQVDENKGHIMTESENIETLLKKRLSSIAEMRESDSYHDYLKTIKDKIIEEKTVFENSKEYISERSSIVESDNFVPTRFSPPKTPPKKQFYLNALNKSNPVLTSDTQFEIYKSLNLDQSTSGTNILRELESRKNLQDRAITVSFNLEKNTTVETVKKVTLDDNGPDKKKNFNMKGYPKTHKTFQNLNYSANVTSILREDPLKRIDQEYEEENLINDKGFVETTLGIPQKSFSSEKLNNMNPIRAKNLPIFQEICSSSKSCFSSIYVK